MISAMSNDASLPRDTEHPLVPIVRDKLRSLGSYDHLLVYRQGDHFFIAHPNTGPEEVDQVLRISGLGHFRFGLSFRRSDGQWEPAPITGVMFHVLAEAVQAFGPWLALRPVMSATCETDH